jgi:O-antigen/teichoic acid export membrane protein
MIWTIGAPYGALVLCQTIQGFSDRFIINAQLGSASAGIYVAAFQICGVPFSLLVTLLNNLLTPIAYQRAKNINDPRQLWAADKLLLAGLLGYLILGAFGVGIYVFFGKYLLSLMTSTSFQLPTEVLICLALSRYIQSATSLLQLFFSVHHKMSASLVYRIFGSIATIPITWWAVQYFSNATYKSGALGASVAGIGIGIGYIALLCFGPAGCYWMIRANRLKI